MSNGPNERERALQGSLGSLVVLLMISFVSAAVVVLFGLAFHP